MRHNRPWVRHNKKKLELYLRETIYFIEESLKTLTIKIFTFKNAILISINIRNSESRIWEKFFYFISYIQTFDYKNFNTIISLTLPILDAMSNALFEAVQDNSISR